MTNLIVRNPLLADMMTLRSAMDRLFDESFVPATASARAIAMPVDIIADEDGYTVHAELPGFTADQISVNVLDNTLTIKAARETRDEQQREGYLHSERRFGSIERTFNLPTLLNPNGAEASLKDGVLTLRVPKAEAAKPRQIAIKPVISNN